MYAQVWDTHVLPRIGGLELRQVTPEALDGFQSDLRQAGVGEPTITKAFTILSGMLGRAATWGRIPRNPVADVQKPRQPKQRRAVAVAPTVVEEIRAGLLADGRPGDATLVSVLAYAGLRPGEALALTWGHVGEKTLHVESAVSLGEMRPTKTRERRNVRLLAAVAQDLREWRLFAGRPPDSSLVFPRRDGEPWRDTDYRNWRRRVFQPAAEAAAGRRLRIYDLRHSFVSLLAAEGNRPIEIAEQAGSSVTMIHEVYEHVLAEFNGQSVNAEEAIRVARMFPQCSPDDSEETGL